jgi:hypothetical protein
VGRVTAAQQHSPFPLLQNMGYRGDIGYSQFLYPTERNVRRLIQWFIMKLPKEEAADALEDTSAGALLKREITRSFGTWVTATWQAPRRRCAPRPLLHTHTLQLLASSSASRECTPLRM